MFRQAFLTSDALLRIVALQELPPWYLQQQNLSRRVMGQNPRHCMFPKYIEIMQPGTWSFCCGGVDLLGIDGRLAVLCCCETGNVTALRRDVKRFLRTARWVCKVRNPEAWQILLCQHACV